MNRKSRQPDFEKSLQELEQLVERLEAGDLPLEESLRTFERGVALTRDCQLALQSAQARVEILLQRDGRTETGTFDADRAESEPEAEDADDEDEA
ncbi:MAG: exodeoxyribonuclease VII small subunit [Steroidobacteraceae bacterium]|nr:exodeoxyribonuclease VII small subunit [Nevskiaceae bacterium]MCP5339546.1 exodeoxyribonuclease VII small subunit [Nevskiaceae bacterium]MCP5359162.1 exodeoxyribonuclease VII small subunit [Nevskiaceae bacterium]MCP5466396.1 exodeoxyribonuclease VII small subunit [Nevskiaceae bacterium]MCP5471903.1 exodeoxyribonuclease VII small subunit [Nevskiaceae bacterium]